MIPVPEESHARHLEDAANVAWLATVQKQIRLGSVAIDIPVSVQKLQSHQGIQKIPRGSRMQTQSSAQPFEILWSACQLAEDAYLYRAQKRLRRPVRETCLQNVVWCQTVPL